MKEYRLNIDPRILELLGPNLYTNIYYVLAELIANAYDADASNVYIVSKENEIRVEDDGHGMSYSKGEIDGFLNVAAISRTSEDDSFTKSGKRKKMGRKGVGKLAALSVSENVDILTISNGEKSGFVLSRKPLNGDKLQPIGENDIRFDFVEDHGTAIVMKNPRYRLHKTLGAIERNLLKIFPLVDSDFRIHIVRGDERVTIDRFDENIMKELCSLITLGDRFEKLGKLVPDYFNERRDELVVAKEKKIIPITMMNNEGVEKEYLMEIEGWIGTYKTTRGRKAKMTDFPDNFISLFANKKLGEFNILPIVGQNKLNEVYVVGQLHIDLFELSELPDMALSNRQGYKSDDPRYIALLDYVRDELLPEILSKRQLFTDLGKKKKKLVSEKQLLEKEAELKESMKHYRKSVSEQIAHQVSKFAKNIPIEDVTKVADEILNENSPKIGLKREIDSQKKKILISQTYPDKPFADIVFEMLLHNNVPAEDILYTNCDDEACRIPEGEKVYEYLRNFFVESLSTEKIFVVFVTSENTRSSWGAITEVGAAWITKIDHKIFNIYPFRPEHPLDDESQWQSTNREKPTKGELWMNRLNADIFCRKIEDICDRLGYVKKSREDNMKHLSTLVEIRKL